MRTTAFDGVVEGFEKGLGPELFVGGRLGLVMNASDGGFGSENAGQVLIGVLHQLRRRWFRTPLQRLHPKTTACLWRTTIR